MKKSRELRNFLPFNHQRPLKQISNLSLSLPIQSLEIIKQQRIPLTEMQRSQPRRLCDTFSLSTRLSSTSLSSCNIPWNYSRNRLRSILHQVEPCPFRGNRTFRSRARSSVASSFSSFSSSASTSRISKVEAKRPSKGIDTFGLSSRQLSFDSRKGGIIERNDRPMTSRRRLFSSISNRRASSSSSGPPKKGDKGEIIFAMTLSFGLLGRRTQG